MRTPYRTSILAVLSDDWMRCPELLGLEIH
jgi:hypothetical protein